MTASRPAGVSKDHIVLAYIAYSRFMAVLAFLLPVALMLSSLVYDGGRPRESLSAYYFGADLQRDYFVGSLCAVAAFLALYKGWRGWEASFMNVASLAAVVVAFVPAPLESTGFGSIHGAAAVTLFVCLVAVGVVLPLVRKKRGRGRVPPLVGYGISTAVMSAGALLAALGRTVLPGRSLLFWGEVLLVLGFGVFWWLRTRHLTNPQVRPALLE